jgi:hypothetical protein
MSFDMLAAPLATQHPGSDRLGASLARHLNDPATIVISDLFIQAWAVSPTPNGVSS